MNGNGRARRLMFKGEVESRADADALLKAPGDAVIVRRGRIRSIVISCPDKCGTVLTINLDPKSGPSWSLYLKGRTVTLFPSIWLESGCKSHFIIWRDRIIWCDHHDEYEFVPEYDDKLEERVQAVLDRTVFKSERDIADLLDELPWEIERVCHQLVKRNLAVSGSGKLLHSYRKVTADRVDEKSIMIRKLSVFRRILQWMFGK